MLTRRAVLSGLTAIAASGATVTAYATGIEPWWVGVTRYAFTPPRWPPGLRLRLVALADIHACEPWMSAERVAGIVTQTNALEADLVVLLGDYGVATAFHTGEIPAAAWAGALGRLRAPLGVHAVIGNHDWWEDPAAQRRGGGTTVAHRALADTGITVHANSAVRVAHDGRPLWIAGLEDQLAIRHRERETGRRWSRGLDDLPATLAGITDDAPVILLAHEPDIFPSVPGRVALTLAGHTHGGQIAIAGFAPIVPSRYGRRYRYGRIVEDGRNLIVSAGIGTTALPVRFGAPPEIVVVELGGSAV